MALPLKAMAALATCACLAAACTHELASIRTADDRGLYFNREQGQATLAYGRPNSDDVGLMMRCRAGSRRIDVSDVARGRGRTLVLASGPSRLSLAARIEDATGQPTLWATTDITAPAMQAFRRSGRMDVGSGGGRYSLTASRDELVGVEAFFRACEAG